MNKIKELIPKIFGVLCSLVSLVIFDPLDSLAHLPNALSLFTLFDVNSLPVLFTLAPFTYVFSTIGPFEGSVALFLVILVGAFVSTPIAPSKSALAFHFVVNPLSIVNTTIGPLVLTLSVNVVLEEVSVVRALI